MIYRVASGGAVATAVIVWLTLSSALFNLGPYPAVRSAGDQAPLLEERFGYTAEAAHDWLERIGPDGRARYRVFQLLDVLNALLISAALALALAFSLPRLFGVTSPIVIAAYLPMVMGLTDLVENGLLFNVVSAFPDEPGALLPLSSLVTQLKLVLAFSLLPLTALSFIILFVKWIWRRIRPPSAPPAH